MKKLGFLFSILLIGSLLITSCSKDESEKSQFEENYFSIEKAIYQSGNIPSATISNQIEGISLNGNALSGGMNFITIISEQKYSKFFVSVKGVDGYWEYDATSSTNSGYNTYSIPIVYSTTYNSNITMEISAQNSDGTITKPYDAKVNYVKSESGDLNVNLTFSNGKDIDLHMIMPDETEIYFGNRGTYSITSSSDTIFYGLDHDSNACCDIDNLNNENIYIPEELVQSGTYSIIVDMFENCDIRYSTNWAVIARYQGKLLTNELGSNPVLGTYPDRQPEDDMTEVIRFTINKTSTKSAVSKIKLESFKPFPLSIKDRIKMEEKQLRGK